MSEETTEVSVVVKPVRGPNGRVGVATASSALKQQWHEKHFKHVDTSDNQHHFRKNWRAQRDTPSLKTFVRGLAKDGNETAKMWLAAKNGEFNLSRSEKNIALSAEISRASKTKKPK